MEASLRERKKIRTRQVLIETALARFTENGFDAITLDQLCADAEVSKRTFFRYFGSKEDAALAPIQDMWTVFLGELDTAEPDDGTLFGLLFAVLARGIRSMPDDGWADRVLLSQRLTAATPTMGAQQLAFCDRTSRAALDVLTRRFGLTAETDPRPRLALDVLIASFRWALEGWAAGAEPGTREELIARTGVALQAASALATVALPGPADG